MPRKGTRNYNFNPPVNPYDLSQFVDSNKLQIVTVTGDPVLTSVKGAQDEQTMELGRIRRANELILGQEVEESE